MNSKARRKLNRASKIRDYTIRHMNDEFMNSRVTFDSATSLKNDHKNYNRKNKTRKFKSKVHKFAASVQKFYDRYRTDGGRTSGPQIHNTFNKPSIPRLKRAVGLMTKARREMQKQLATGRETIYG